MEQRSIMDRVLRVLEVLFGILEWVFKQLGVLFGKGRTLLASATRGEGGAGQLTDRARQVASGATEKAQHMATGATEKAQAVAGDVMHRAEGLKEQVGHVGEAGALGDRARQMVSEAGEKAQAVIGDVRQRAEERMHGGGQQGEGGEAAMPGAGTSDVIVGLSDPAEFRGAERFATEYGQADQSVTSTGIPTTSREQMFTAGAVNLGGTEAEREARAEAAGGEIADRPDEMGVDRRSGAAMDEENYAYGTDQGVPIAESMYETTVPAADNDESTEVGEATEDEVIADAVQSSTSDSDVDMAAYEDVPEMTNITPDDPNDTWQRTSDEVYDSFAVSQDLDLTDNPSGEIVDQGEPWTAESPEDLDFPAASRGVRLTGEESETAGLNADTGEGFGREEDELLTSGGEIDLENDEAPTDEASDTQDVVLLEEADEDGEVTFGGEDTMLAGDTLGLRESEDEPIAGRNDDVSLRIATGGVEDEERLADLSEINEDLDVGPDVGEGGDPGDDNLSLSREAERESGRTGNTGDNLGISGDYDKATETQKIEAKPEDTEAGAKGSTGAGPEADKSSAPAGDTTGEKQSGNRQSARAQGGNVPQGAVRGDGSKTCPAEYPIKGNASSRIYHMPGQSSYDQTVPEFCFATEAAAQAAGFRARRA